MPALRSAAVVIADDDADDLFFARRCLQKVGVSGDILMCADGTEVVTFLERIGAGKHALPRVIFLDVKMPQLNGFETLKWIRSRDEFRSVAVVMLSGSKETRDVELARTLGANDYLVKYPKPSEFSRILAEADRANDA
jgi:CheY-like chemotaxis protein